MRSSIQRRLKILRGDPSSEKSLPRKSKLDYLRRLLKRSGKPLAAAQPPIVDPPPPVREQSAQEPIRLVITDDSNNKPLPPPPPPNREEQIASPSSSQSNRILTPLGIDDWKRIFSGAPHFSVAHPDKFKEYGTPFVSFPWDAESDVQATLSDSTGMDHAAFFSATLRPRDNIPSLNMSTIQENEDPGKEPDVSPERQTTLSRLHVLESPNMLSFQGVEPGTFGYASFLEIGEPSPRREGDAGSRQNDSTGPREAGIREIDITHIVERLREVENNYKALMDNPPLEPKSSVELYSDLFTGLLQPPTRVDSEDPYSLAVQVQSLLQALALPAVWFDFYKVESRLGFGQVLWGSLNTNDEEPTDKKPGICLELEVERKHLLLQILLACELYLRLESPMAEEGGELKCFRRKLGNLSEQLQRKVLWDLVFAHQWLHNVLVLEQPLSTQSAPLPQPPETPKKQANNWFFSGSSTVEEELPIVPVEEHETIDPEIIFCPRHKSRQISGLLHFAQVLNWPKRDLLKNNIHAMLKASSIAASGVATPLSMTSSIKSGFSLAHRPNMAFGLNQLSDSRFQGKSSKFLLLGVGGWLSRIYLTGMALPGDTICHLLMSTLLESDNAAMERLGNNANLYGGFAYENRTWWSKSCVVGRVLAALEGSSECMGWISAAVMPDGDNNASFEEGWLECPVESSPTKDRWKRHHLQEKSVENRSGVLGNEGENIIPGDFALPDDAQQNGPSHSIVFKGLALKPKGTSQALASQPPNSDAPAHRSFEASLSFTIYPSPGFSLTSIPEDRASSENDKEVPESQGRVCNLLILNDVQFLTAFPCRPPPHSSIVSRSSSPVSSPIEISSTVVNPASAPVHPLHKSYSYAIKTMQFLLEAPSLLHRPSLDESEVWIIAAYNGRPKTANPSDSAFRQPIKEAKGAEEAFARAWCAQNNLSAIISRRGQSCLSCSVREAMAVDMRVVIRI
ncbi:MAG: hypothetical protein M1829_003669 [Trizodia sp. TS-e1964]|nr:MAG: hypothetical protein M1829_003669 [Trizodia sp. TS-e1964]